MFTRIMWHLIDLMIFTSFMWYLRDWNNVYPSYVTSKTKRCLPNVYLEETLDCYGDECFFAQRTWRQWKKASHSRSPWQPQETFEQTPDPLHLCSVQTCPQMLEMVKHSKYSVKIYWKQWKYWWKKKIYYTKCLNFTVLQWESVALIEELRQ